MDDIPFRETHGKDAWQRSHRDGHYFFTSPDKKQSKVLLFSSGLIHVLRFLMGGE